jgi:hypothetical protein
MKAAAKSGEVLTVLVIQQDAYDWEAILSAAVAKHPHGQELPKLRVVQTAWDDIDVGPVENDTYHSGDLYDALPRRYIKFPVRITQQWKNGSPVAPTAPGAKGPATASKTRPLTIYPNFVLVRNEYEVPGKSFRHQLLALAFADCPSVNAIQSMLLMGDKPVSQGALHRLRNTKFADRPVDFPLIEQTFAPQHTAFFYGRTFPAVVKLGTAHAGFGKLKIPEHHAMEDIRTLLPMTVHKYCTAEPFVEAAGDLRLQRIGQHYRAFFRRSTCGAWKTNTQSSVLDEVDVTPQMVEWLEAAATMFGRDPRNRMEILTVDAVVRPPPPSDSDDPNAPPAYFGMPAEELAKLSRAHILEVNGTSSGLSPDTAAEDNAFMAELVLDKLCQMLPVATADVELVPCTSGGEAFEPPS